MPRSASSDSTAGDTTGDTAAAGVKDTASDGFIAKDAITINGARAYNKGARVSANAVKKNNLEQLVEKA